MSNHSRAQLLGAEATLNQVRNAMYFLVRFMDKKGVKDVSARFQRMGRRIASTYVNYWKPTESVNLSNIKDVIATIYKNMFGSNIIVEINESEKHIIIKDTKCSMCKYKYDDVDIAGCEVLLGLVSEFINLINKDSKSSAPLLLEPVRIAQSKALGHDSCIQVHKYNLGGN